MTLSLFIDLGQTENLTTSSTQTIAKITRNIGLITDYNHMVNQPIYLKNRPNNNVFSVKIVDATNTVYTTNYYDYILTLHFELLAD